MKKNTAFITEASFEKLLGARPFIRVGEQLFFYHEELKKHVITEIYKDANYTATKFNFQYEK